MKIRFSCTACGRNLSIAKEKVGKRVRCPKCDTVLAVPTAEQQAVAAAMAGKMPPPESVSDVADIHFDVGVGRPADDPSGADFDADRVSISRGFLYAQGVLIALVALLAFTLGYALGSATAGRSAKGGGAADFHQGPVRVAGTLQYRSANDDMKADGGAVVIVLPAGKYPDEKLNIAGLRPMEPEPAPDHVALRAIAALGGAYRRTDDNGRFDLEVVNSGKYQVLLLSRNARRRGAETLKADDLRILGSFFHDAPDLLGDRRYALELVDVRQDSDLDHQF